MIQGPALEAAGVSSRRLDPASAAPDAPPPGKSGSLFALGVALLLPAGLVAQLAHPLAGLLWTELFVFLLPAAVATWGSGLEPGAWLRLRPPTARGAAVALLVGGAGWLLGSSLFAVGRALAPRALVEQYDLSRLFEGPVPERLAFVAIAVFVAPICEELCFRGHLAAALHSRHRPGLAIGAGALLFALLHLDPLRGPALVALGAIYGWLAWRSGSIWPAVIAHAANNGIAAALALWTGGDAGAGGEPSLRGAIAGVALGAALLALAVALFRRTVPPAVVAAGLPRAGAGDPSLAFRLSRIPRALLALAVAGWVALGAMLL
jgi:membrane protease YdiL (CAAX protease family)